MKQKKRNMKKSFQLISQHIKVTDPELIEIFDNLAFDEEISHGN